MKRSATAVWSGSLKEGNGNLTAPSGVLHSTQYSFGSRFDKSPGISPDELIAAAHAGCYAMKLSGLLEAAGFKPERLEVLSEVTVDETAPDDWTISGSHLTVQAKVSSIEAEQFLTLAQNAATHCPVSRVLKAAITLDAKLV